MVQVAGRGKVTEASCLLVYLHYRHAPRTPGRGPLRFLGSVPFKTA